MNIWKPDSIEQEPEVILTQWNVMKLMNGDKHFVGWNTLLREGRVSSRIKEFDNATMIGKTRSDRTYKLDGPSGVNHDAMYVWQMWCRINKVDPESAIVANEEFENVVQTN